jgi:hypothetical protein
MTAQNNIIVAFSDSTGPGNPFKVSGSVSLRELTLGNQLQYSWGQHISVRNISGKPALLLVASLRQIGRRSQGDRHSLDDGMTFVMTEDRFFSDGPIASGDSVELRNTEPEHFETKCCINPLEATHAPEAQFKVLFVEFTDGSTFGDTSAAAEAFAARARIVNSLRDLVQSSSRIQVSEDFKRMLDARCAILGWAQCRRIGTAYEQGGSSNAVNKAKGILEIAERHERDEHTSRPSHSDPI